MRHWLFILVTQFLATILPAQASSNYGPKDNLFDFADFEWLEDGVWLCVDDCDSTVGWVLFVFAEPAVSRLTVHVLDEIEGHCPILTELLAGPVYRDIEHAGFLTFVSDIPADEDGPYIIALDWTEFVENETGHLFYIWVDQLGGIWSDIIDDRRAALEELRLEYDPEGWYFFAGKLNYRASTSGIQKAQLIEKLVRFSQDHEWDDDDIEANCLSADQVERLGLMR